MPTMTERAFLSHDGQLWTERIGPARTRQGAELFDCCGRGPPLSSPDGWPLAPVPATKDIVFRGLQCINESTMIAWTDHHLYFWGGGQAVMQNYVAHTPTMLWTCGNDGTDGTDGIANITATDRALLIITWRGRLFGMGNLNWGSCTPNEWQYNIVEIAVPEGKRAMRVVIRAYFSNTQLQCTDGSTFRCKIHDTTGCFGYSACWVNE